MVSKNKITAKKYGDSVEKYIKGINKGLLKIMSKMGISCVSSYRGAQLFEKKQHIQMTDEVEHLNHQTQSQSKWHSNRNQWLR